MKQTDLMPWGKYKGTPINKINKQYLRALYAHGILDGKLRLAVWERLYGNKIKDDSLTSWIEAMCDDSGQIPFWGQENTNRNAAASGLAGDGVLMQGRVPDRASPLLNLGLWQPFLRPLAPFAPQTSNPRGNTSTARHRALPAII